MKVINYSEIFLLLVLSFSLVTCGGNDHKNVESIAIPVEIQVAERTTYTEQLVYSGILRPIKEMKLMSDIPGKVYKLYVDEGTKVKKGQLLAEMDTKTIRLRLAQAKAGLSVAKARHNSAKRDWERFERLRGEEAVSEQQAEKITLAYEAAQAQLQQAEAALNIALHSEDVSLINAPFDGIISAKYVDEGDMINPQMSMGGKVAVFSIMDYSKIEVKIEVAERHIKRFKKGMKALLKTNTDPDKVYTGLVNAINYAADPMSRSFSVKVVFDNSDFQLLPNTVGDISVVLFEKPNTYSFPLTTLIEGKYVYTVNKGKAVRNEVRIGHLSETNIEVSEGISAGDTVITKGSYALREGSRILIENE
jgi:RND family efflux transporter MFP subunit